MQQELIYIDQNRVILKYILPLSEVIVDFHDQIKSLSSGYARYCTCWYMYTCICVYLCVFSFDYEDHGYQPASVLKVCCCVYTSYPFFVSHNISSKVRNFAQWYCCGCIGLHCS